jgi:hypothetical protein
LPAEEENIMPALAQYVLRNCGHFKGEKEALIDAEAEFNGIFQKPDRSAKSREGDEGWPHGVWLPSYNLCHWKATVETPQRYPDVTLFDFRAEINGTKSGQLYDNKYEMLKDVEWFYSSVEKKWHKELVSHITGFNERWKGKVLCRLWFCEWRWYCGNGGY